MDPLFILLTLIFSALGAYLGSYLKKKGENLATHEDIDKLLAQVTAVTQATKEIEAKISVDIWDRQKKWGIKRDAFFEAVKELATAEDALTFLDSTYELARSSNSENASWWINRKADANERWSEARSSFKSAYELATLVCDQDVREAFDIVQMSILLMGFDIMGDKPNALAEAFPRLAPEMRNLKTAIRRELGMPITPEKGQQ